MLWATTLLEHFGLDGVDNSPNLGEVRTEGLLDFVTAAAVDNAGDENPGIAASVAICGYHTGIVATLASNI